MCKSPYLGSLKFNVGQMGVMLLKNDKKTGEAYGGK